MRVAVHHFCQCIDLHDVWYCKLFSIYRRRRLSVNFFNFFYFRFSFLDFFGLMDVYSCTSLHFCLLQTHHFCSLLKLTMYLVWNPSLYQIGSVWEREWEWSHVGGWPMGVGLWRWLDLVTLMTQILAVGGAEWCEVCFVDGCVGCGGWGSFCGLDWAVILKMTYIKMIWHFKDKNVILAIGAKPPGQSAECRLSTAIRAGT